jgi:hypothetical protein
VNTPNEEPTQLTLTPAQKVALEEMIADRLWWDEALRRGRKFGIIIAAGAATLAFLAVWWPWITAMAQAILKDVPRS